MKTHRLYIDALFDLEGRIEDGSAYKELIPLLVRIFEDASNGEYHKLKGAIQLIERNESRE